jgi:hypothetical protein
MKHILPLIAVAVGGIWFIVRSVVFVAELFNITVPNDIYRVTTWMLRMIILLISGCAIVVAIPMGLFAIGMGDSFGGGTSYAHLYITIISIGLYALAAFIMNFPKFPHEKNVKWYLPAHAILFPCIASLAEPLIFLILMLIVGAFSMLWLLYQSDRKRFC